MDCRPCVLSGRVVDEQGNPVRKFDLRVHLQYSYQDSYRFKIDHPEGRFDLKCPQPIAGYIVQAEQFALEQRGFLERTELTIPETANQAILLKRGFRISGSVTLTKEHRKPITLVLVDRRTDTLLFQWKAVNELDRDWSQPKLENKKSFPSFEYIYQYRKQPWVFELFGSVSIVSEKLLLSKKIELKAGETNFFDGNPSVPH